MPNSNWQNDMWHAPQDEHRQQAQAAGAAKEAADAQGAPRQTAEAGHAPAQAAQSTTQPARPMAGQAPAYGGYASPAAGGMVFAAPPKQKSHTWIVALVVIVLLFALIFFCISSCTSLVSSTLGQATSLTTVHQTVATSGPTIGIIEVTGTIQYDGTTSSPEGLKSQLDRAENDPNIKAVVLRVDSGGGTSTAGEEMAIYVRDFSKPVVVSSASLNASAAYEISSQADYIFVDETTAIGSIGTIMQMTDLSGLMEMLGIKMEMIVSSPSKDASFGYRPLTDEEREHYQAMVDQINQTFIDKVAAGRNMSVEDVTKLANGMTYTGIDAVQNGLADEIGTLGAATAKACELADIDEAATMYLRPAATTNLSALIDYLRSEDENISVSDLERLAKELEGYDTVSSNDE